MRKIIYYYENLLLYNLSGLVPIYWLHLLVFLNNCASSSPVVICIVFHSSIVALAEIQTSLSFVLSFSFLFVWLGGFF